MGPGAVLRPLPQQRTTMATADSDRPNQAVGAVWCWEVRRHGEERPYPNPPQGNLQESRAYSLGQNPR